MQRMNAVHQKLGSQMGFLLVLCLLSLVYGCGGGGGSSSGTTGGNAGVRGKIVLVSTNSNPAPTTTVSLGGVSVLASDTDGTFTLLNGSASETTLTIVNADAAKVEQFRRTLTVSITANQTTDLGVIYVGDQGYNANVNGRVVTNINGVNQPVTNAKITLSGLRTVTGVNGTFQLTGLPVGLGSLPGALLGEVVATGFETKPIFSETLGPPLLPNNNNVGDIVIAAPVGSTPPPPHTITGRVTVQGANQAGVMVSLKVGVTELGSTTTDASGSYFFWVVPDTYTITASKAGFISKQTSVTLQRLSTPVTASTLNLTP